MMAPSKGKGLLIALGMSPKRDMARGDSMSARGGDETDEADEDDYDDEGDEPEGPDDAQTEAAQGLIEAVKKGDATEVYHAFRALKDSCDDDGMH